MIVESRINHAALNEPRMNYTTARLTVEMKVPLYYQQGKVHCAFSHYHQQRRLPAHQKARAVAAFSLPRRDNPEQSTSSGLERLMCVCVRVRGGGVLAQGRR